MSDKQQAGGGPEVYGQSDFNVWRAQLEAAARVQKEDPRLGQCVAQQPHAPGTSFTRAEVLAVLKAKKAMITAMANPLEVLAHLILAFERME